MPTRYFIAPANQVPNGGTQLIRTGIPVQRDMVNDICICCEGSYDYIYANTIVLREALLRNPNATKMLLGLIVKDANEVEVELKEEKKKAKEVKTNE